MSMTDKEKYKKLERLAFLKMALYPPVPVRAMGMTTGGAMRDVLSKALAMVTIMGGIGLGTEALSRAASSPIGSIPNSLAKGQAFQGMLEVAPDLRQEDPHKVKSMFDVLYQFFPAGAAQPMTAAGIVGSLTQYDRVDHKTIQDFVKMQKDYSDTHAGARRAPSGISESIISAIPSLFS